MAFSASEAAFEGFRIIRREPKAAVVWAAVLVIFSIVSLLAMLPFMRGVMASGAAGASPQSTTQAIAFAGQMGRLYLVMIPLYLVVASVFSAAVYRSILRPEEKGLARLRLGGDELRLAGLWVLMGLFFVVILLAVGIVLGLVIAGLSFAARGSSAWLELLPLLMWLVAMCAWVWIGVRLSFAAPLTFARRRIDIFGSWKLTKGRFWSLFGCYLLAIVCVALVALVDFAVSGALAIGMNGGSFSRGVAAIMRPDYSSYASLFTPLYVVRVLVGAAFSVVMWTVIIAAPAAAFREIAGPKPEDQAAAFS